MPAVNRRTTETALFSHDEWQPRDIDLILDYFDARAGTTDAAARLVIQQNWRAYDFTHEDDLKALYDYVNTTLAVNVITGRDAFVLGMKDRRRAAFRHKQQVIDLLDSGGAAIDTICLHDWDYQGLVAHGVEITSVNGGNDQLGNAILDITPNGAEVDDGAGAGSLLLAPPTPGHGWYMSDTSPPAPGNKIVVPGTFDQTADWTLEGWFAAEAGAGFIIELHAFNDTTVTERRIVTLRLNGSGNVELEINAQLDDAFIYDSGPVAVTIANAVWYHCAAVFDAANDQYNLYFNGSRVDQSPTAQTNADPFHHVGWATYSAAANGGCAETRLSSLQRYTGATYTVPTAPWTID